MSVAAGLDPDFAGQVRERFARRAADYERHARLQQAMAWRLAHHCRGLDLAAGPCADLGAGSGLLSRALIQQNPGLGPRTPLQLDQCAELLARNPLSGSASDPAGGGALVWDLNTGLPSCLQGAALLASSFALQWLDHPARELGTWCRSLGEGGWLVLAVPTAGSFPQWHQAAERAGVPCTALCLPQADDLIGAVQAEGLQPQLCHRLRFSRPGQGGIATLKHLRQLGASASRSRPLAARELRRLLAHWPAASPLTWEVLLLIARRPG